MLFSHQLDAEDPNVWEWKSHNTEGAWVPESPHAGRRPPGGEPPI